MPDEANPTPSPANDQPAHDLGDDPSLAQLIDRIAELERENADAKGRLLRLMADYQNYQRRAVSNEGVAKQQGIASVATSITSVLDHFEMALKSATSSQVQEGAGAAQVLDGFRVIHEELLKALAQHGVRPVAPKPNDPFEPGRHEAVMQRAGEGIEPGNIVETFQTGYAMAIAGGEERVLRAAKVVVAPRD